MILQLYWTSNQSSGPISANRLRAALSAMWTWGLRTGLIDADNNPVTFTIKQPEKTRDRTLSGAELKAIWHATEDGEDYSSVVRLCLLTGCRRDEISVCGGTKSRTIGSY